MTQLAIAPVHAVLATNTVAPLLTVPAGEENAVSVRVTNYTAVASTVSLWLVPVGEVLADKHRRLADWPLKAKESKDAEVALPLPPGARLYVAAGAVTTIAASIVGTRNIL
ncbi:hypothetical protein [Sphingomonas oligophenolica]|uniref:Uncharacterized protein n=1 Tax=Sphingomonas oligophenolica TaxID=301154 RepID=A0A502CME6_9SPHN|nr:hypothetical protein [Sphingomonas oligophenolica]TPG14367.1 hypothetical protein EAH84_03400 [Sphingomonas oligophenolica]